MAVNSPDIQSCIRCGTCCRKGGPSLHLEDKHLVESGAIASDFLFTIRRGEPAFDNIRGRLAPAATDIIKIKGQGGAWTCALLDPAENSCRIYARRPLECRVLKCWDTRKIKKAYQQDRLTRKDLLGTVQGLWDLVEEHENRCAYPPLLSDAKLLKNGSPDQQEAARRRIDTAVRYDAALRELVLEKADIGQTRLDFLFGRPLAAILKTLGINP